MQRKIFGKKINEIRRMRNITSEKLAEKCDVNPVHIRQIEAGMRLPSLTLLIKICNALKVTPNYLFSQELDIDENQYEEHYKEVITRINELTPREIEMLNRLIDLLIEYQEEPAR